MKHTFKKISSTIIITLVMLLTLTSCYETHYVHHYHHHSREWYGRRHVEPPVGVTFEVEEHRH